jgi:hypothetical protein
MNKEEIKNYLKENLKMDWMYTGDGKLYIVLKLENEVISQMRFHQE